MNIELLESCFKNNYSNELFVTKTTWESVTFSKNVKTNEWSKYHNEI